jgi:hypothetical protein
MSESGAAVQKRPRLSSPHLLRRYLNCLGWLEGGIGGYVCLLGGIGSSGDGEVYIGTPQEALSQYAVLDFNDRAQEGKFPENDNGLSREKR